MDVIATVVSGDDATAPFSGERAAVVVVEALKGDELVGLSVFGDLLRLRWDGGALEILARHARFSFTSMFGAAPAPERVPAELVPMLQRGATAFRERLVKSGARLRVRQRDAASPIQLDEILSFESRG